MIHRKYERFIKEEFEMRDKTISPKISPIKNYDTGREFPIDLDQDENISNDVAAKIPGWNVY